MNASKKRLKDLAAIKDEDIDCSGIPELEENFWRRAERHMPTPKQGVYIRLDADVLDWLKSKGKGYQTCMNAMLRALMESDQRARRRLGAAVVSSDTRRGGGLCPHGIDHPVSKLFVSPQGAGSVLRDCSHQACLRPVIG